MDDPARRRFASKARTLCLALLVLAVAGIASGAEEICAAWPGEPTPLPSVSDSDPVLARWAELRVAELTHHAELSETGDRPESQRLWRRVRCLDPRSEAAERGLARSHSVRVHRPALVRTPPVAAGEALDPWSALGEPLVVTEEPP